MSLPIMINKIRRKIWSKLVKRTRYSKIYPFFYIAYWHSFVCKPKKDSLSKQYLTAVPNQGAGIGHQMANWIAGYWFAKQFGLKFAHIPFSSPQWDEFLGFGEGEPLYSSLKKKGHLKVRLPLFDENNASEVSTIKRIIESYKHRSVVFVCEQDQFYHDQIGVRNDIQQKFFSSIARKKNALVFKSENFNIAIHVRRGDIVTGQKIGIVNHQMRWQNISYFEQVLSAVVSNISTKKEMAIYLFSQGNREDFTEFEKFDNINYCLNMTAQDSFLHMVYADLLITSKSSFSYKPALLSKGIKICPDNFWHAYPLSKDFILADEHGRFNLSLLSYNLHLTN